MSGINPNQDVGASSVEVSSGGTVSVDDMMQLEDAAASRASEAPTEEAPPAAEPAAETKSETQTANEKKVADDKAVDTTPGAGKPALKLLKAKNGDQPFDIPADVVLDVVVDGQKVAVNVQELVNNFAGKTDWTRKYTDLDKERKTFKVEREQVERGINAFVEKAQDPNSTFTDLIASLGEMVGMDSPLDFVRSLRQKLTPDADKWAHMSPEERDVAMVKEENAFFKGKTDIERQRKSVEASNAAILDRVTKVRESYGLSEEQFKSTYHEILKGGKVPEASITPEYVGDYFKVDQVFGKAEKILESIDPELKSDSAALKQLVSIIDGNPDFSEEDHREIAEAMIGKKAKRSAKALSDKVRSTEPKVAAKRAPQNPQNEPINFDDI